VGLFFGDEATHPKDELAVATSGSSAETVTLKEIMKDASKKARARGLTPEILESLLKEA